MPIEVWLEKSLLEFVEKTNKPRLEISLLEVCVKTEDIFGIPGEEQRCAVQLHWNNLKRRSIHSYADLLDKHKVDHSVTMAKSLVLQGTAQSPPSENKDSDHPLQMYQHQASCQLPT
jgi:hypothetical protein